jgi:uncharacterized Tic20 family protein
MGAEPRPADAERTNIIDHKGETMNTNAEQRNIAMLVHLGGIFFGFLPSLIVYLVKKDDPYLCEQSKEALNFQITVLIAMVVAWLSMFLLIGFLLLPLVALANLVLCIIAAVKTSNGVNYRYPFTLRLLA